MFGYVKPYRPDLRVREYEAYRGVYCGICREIGRSFGQRARLALGYDSVFVAMLAADVRREALCFGKCRCAVHPFDGHRACAAASESTRLAGGWYLILLWHKLCDDVADSGSLRARFVRFWLRRAHKKAARLYPEVERIAAEYVAAQQRVEQSSDERMAAGEAPLPLDAFVDPSAHAMAALFETISEQPDERRVLSRVGYMLGRWVYLIDAADDYEKDIARRRFNALARAWPPETTSDPKTRRERAAQSLRLTRGELESACALLPEGMFAPILANIVQQGLEAEARRVLVESSEKGRNS